MSIGPTRPRSPAQADRSGKKKLEAEEPRQAILSPETEITKPKATRTTKRRSAPSDVQGVMAAFEKERNAVQSLMSQAGILYKMLAAKDDWHTPEVKAQIDIINARIRNMYSSLTVLQKINDQNPTQHTQESIQYMESQLQSIVLRMQSFYDVRPYFSTSAPTHPPAPSSPPQKTKTSFWQRILPQSKLGKAIFITFAFVTLAVVLGTIAVFAAPGLLGIVAGVVGLSVGVATVVLITAVIMLPIGFFAYLLLK